MAETLLIFLLIQGFNQKWFIPRGATAGRICVTDTDRDSNYEFVIRTYGGSQKIYFYELHLPNTWEVDSFSYFWGPLVWDVGDFDIDGMFDLIIHTAVDTPPKMLVSIAESPDSFSYPTQEVWRDTVGFPLATPICTYDIDQDGLSEIVKVIGDTTIFDIYESIGDDIYQRIFRDTMVTGHNPKSTFAFGDFDSDSRNEFVFGYSGGEYDIWECNGNNSYQEIIHYQQLPTDDISDCFTIPDADGDGKMEFVLKGEIDIPAIVQPFIFEATGDNTYQVIKSFSFADAQGEWYAGGYSDAGDLDADGSPEIALEAASYVYIIKSAGNDSFYVWDTLSGHPDGSSVRVFDIDNNGLSEVIVSGGNETRIYEKGVDVVWFCPEPYDTFHPLDTLNFRWRVLDTLALDSLRLYVAHPQFGCSQIYAGLPTDTMCQWIAPDTQSVMVFKLWLAVNGFGRYDSISSPPFYIKREQGIIEQTSLVLIPELEISPNPFRTIVTIKFQIPNRHETWRTKNQINSKSQTTLNIYDITGRLVKYRSLTTPYSLLSTVVWDGTDDSGCQMPAGVYFVQLKNQNFCLIKKIVKLK